MKEEYPVPVERPDDGGQSTPGPGGTGLQGPPRAGADGGDGLTLIFRHYQESLKRFFRRRLGTGPESADAVQEVFLRAVKENRQEPLKNPRAFLYVTAANLVKDERRKQRSRMAARHGSFKDDVPCTQPAPERVVAARQEFRVLLDALKELDPKYRKAFVLHRFHELTYDQIAAEMGISVSSVQNYISLVMAHSRTRLQRAT